ncbi:hypothetical protein QJS04_geneDACA005506 [Acorus gramineus]|uniref:Uncharacterized protein n=1 Tax=Acorus gramineus TaxID=55184 RepID=A0AAV9A6S1_ACOGR|nr:hypothetical protein QJS04_geneDACA005506 [Acorus gramineus]
MLALVTGPAMAGLGGCIRRCYHDCRLRGVGKYWCAMDCFNDCLNPGRGPSNAVGCVISCAKSSCAVVDPDDEGKMDACIGTCFTQCTKKG